VAIVEKDIDIIFSKEVLPTNFIFVSSLKIFIQQLTVYKSADARPYDL